MSDETFGFHMMSHTEKKTWTDPTSHAFIGLISGKIYRKPWFLPSNIGLSCKFSHHPIL
jgi:hypothetical protein